MRWKRPLFALVTVVAFFALLELALWAAGVRTVLAERDPFLGFSEQIQVFELDRDAGMWRTPPRATRHSFNDQQFAADKPEDGFRVFTIGGSSAYGFPWGAGEAFPRFLGDALAASHPGRHVESVNAAAMSYGSHRLRILAHELLRYEPDLLVVYGGHNEFIERRFYRDRIERSEQLDRLTGLLSRSRLYSALSRLYQAGPEPSPVGETSDTASLLGLDVSREFPQDVAEAEREDVRRHFAANLEAILDLCDREGVAVILCTVPSNLSGWQPNQSLFPQGITAAERQALERALDAADDALARGDPEAAARRLDAVAAQATPHAAWWFARGRVFQSLGSVEEARSAFVRARDLDGGPSRAIGALNDTLRDLARSRGVPLVDVERLFEEVASDAVPGFNLFEDYVHPKPAAHRLIAAAVWEAVEHEGLAGAARTPVDDEFWAAIGSARPDLAALDDAPEAQAEARTPAMLFNLAIVLENQGLHDKAMEKYRDCLALHPGYFYARSNLARLLYKEGRYAEAIAEHRIVLADEPTHMRSLNGLGEALRRTGRVEEALAAFEHATEVDPRSAVAWQFRGLTLMQLKRTSEAESAFRRAAELTPDDAAARVQHGGALLYLDRLDEAEASFRQARRLEPGNLKAGNGLAAVMAKRGRFDEAETLYRETLRLEPENSQALSGLGAVARLRARSP